MVFAGAAANVVGIANNAVTNTLSAVGVSNNDGLTWAFPLPGPPFAFNPLANNGSHAVAIVMVNPNLYYIGSSDSGTGHGVPLCGDPRADDD